MKNRLLLCQSIYSSPVFRSGAMVRNCILEEVCATACRLCQLNMMRQHLTVSN